MNFTQSNVKPTAIMKTSIPILGILASTVLAILPASAATTHIFNGPDKAELLDHLTQPAPVTGGFIQVRGTGGTARTAVNTRGFSAGRISVGTSGGAGVLYLNAGDITLTDGLSQTLAIGRTNRDGALYLNGGSVTIVGGGVGIGSPDAPNAGNGTLIVKGGAITLADPAGSRKAVFWIATGGNAGSSGSMEIAGASITGGFILGNTSGSAAADSARLTVHGDAVVGGVANCEFTLRKTASVSFVLTPGGDFKTFDQSRSNPAQINENVRVKLDVSRLDPAAVAARPGREIVLLKVNPKTDDTMWTRFKRALVLAGYDAGTLKRDAGAWSFAVKGVGYTLVPGWDDAARTLKLQSLAKAP